MYTHRQHKDESKIGNFKVRAKLKSRSSRARFSFIIQATRARLLNRDVYCSGVAPRPVLWKINNSAGYCILTWKVPFINI